MELAIKRSVLERSLDNSQKTISFLSIVNSALGSINVNFDAETQKETLNSEEYEKVYDFGEHWSETYQASALHDGQSLVEKAAEVRSMLKKFGRRFSANLVVGNAAYGFKPEFSSLHELAMKLSGASKHRLKLGVEGKRNGKLAIELASKTNSMAYVLHTASVHELLGYAKTNHVDSIVYALCRFSEEGMGHAASDLMRIKGASYFERRGVSTEQISSRLGEFAMFGTGWEVALQIRKLIDRGTASKIALYPVFSDSKDLINQMKLLSQVIADA